MQASAALARILADFAVGRESCTVPQAVMDDAKLRLLDIVGLCLCASRTADSHNLHAEVQRWGDSGHSTIIGFGRSSAPTAALANGMLSHAEDFDDTHTESLTHVSAVVVPAALAVAEEQGASGAMLLQAIALGHETAVRVGLGAQGRFHARGFHTTGIVGPFGAAIAAGILMRLSADSTAEALAISASMGAGIFEFLANGSTVKRVHPGWAAQCGIAAARLSRGGVTGPPTALEGRQGLYRTHIGEEFVAEKVVSDLGRKWHALDTSFKPYPCCHFLHAPLDALAALQAEHDFAPEDVESMVCLVPAGALPVIAEPVAKKLNPLSGYDAKFSVQFTLAAQLVRRHLDLSSYAPEEVTDPAIRRVMQRVACHADPQSAAYPPSFGGAVNLVLRDGRHLSRRVPHNRGGPLNPMSQNDVEAKFRDNARLALGAAEAELLLRRLLAIESLQDVSRLLPGKLEVSS